MCFLADRTKATVKLIVRLSTSSVSVCCPSVCHGRIVAKRSIGFITKLFTGIINRLSNVEALCVQNLGMQFKGNILSGIRHSTRNKSR